MSALELGAFGLLGLAGSAHCVAMCGGLAVTAAVGASTWRARLARAASYLAGKSLSYALVGALLATVFSLAARGAAEVGGVESQVALDRLRTGLAWLTGLVLIVAGVRLFARANAERPPGWLLALQRCLAPFRRLPANAGAFGLGVSSGFLPCGLSWSAFALALPRPAPEAFLGLLVFGLATGPALVGAIIGAGWVHRRLGARVRFVAAPTLVLVGLLTIVRGGLPASLAPVEQVALPDCCSEP